MTLEEAIIHCEEVVERCEEGVASCDLMDKTERILADNGVKCAAEHRQLAKWLKELKAVHDEIDDAADEDEIFIGYLRKKMRDGEG